MDGQEPAREDGRRQSDAAGPCLVVMAKRPDPGSVKTRLVPPFTPAAAAALYECFLEDTLELVTGTPGVRGHGEETGQDRRRTVRRRLLLSTDMII